MIPALLLVLAAWQDAGPPARGRSAATRGAGTAVAATRVATLDGATIDPFAGDARATALVFIHPDCPVSNRYAPELNRLHDESGARGIRLFVVYPGREDNEEAIRAHYSAFRLRMPALRDPEFLLADRAGATMTPEAAVFVGRALVYRGRIDDRAPRLGVWRARPSSRDLSDVLARIATGERVTPRTTQAVGCYIKPLG